LVPVHRTVALADAVGGGGEGPGARVDRQAGRERVVLVDEALRALALVVEGQASGPDGRQEGQGHDGEGHDGAALPRPADAIDHGPLPLPARQAGPPAGSVPPSPDRREGLTGRGRTVSASYLWTKSSSWSRSSMPGPGRPTSSTSSAAATSTAAG